MPTCPFIGTRCLTAGVLCHGFTLPGNWWQQPGGRLTYGKCNGRSRMQAAGGLDNYVSHSRRSGQHLLMNSTGSNCYVRSQHMTKSMSTGNNNTLPYQGRCSLICVGKGSVNQNTRILLLKLFSDNFMMDLSSE